jgi:hypothetical protein
MKWHRANELPDCLSFEFIAADADTEAAIARPTDRYGLGSIQ